MKYTDIIFDVDGTLSNTLKALVESWKSILLDITGKTFPDKVLSECMGMSGDDIFRKFGIYDRLDHYSRIWSGIFKELLTDVRPYDGITETLQSLEEKGYRLGIITSRHRSDYEEYRDLDSIKRYFTTVITVEDSARPKPNADPVHAYAEKTGASLDRIIYIGDAVFDYECAMNAGVDFGLALWGAQSPEKIGAAIRLSHPSEILDIV